VHQPCNEPCSIAITSYNRLESCLLGSLAEAALHTGKNDSEVKREDQMIDAETPDLPSRDT